MIKVLKYWVFLLVILLFIGASAQIAENTDSTDIIEPEESHVILASDSTALITPRLVDTNIVIPSLDFNGVTLQDAFTALIRAYKLSVFIDSSVTGSISMRLDNVTLNDALLFIIKEYNLDWTRTGDIIKVYRPTIKPPPPPPLDIQYHDNKLSFNLKNADLEKLVTDIIELTGYNIMIDDNAKGNITGRLVDIEFEKGMKAVLNSNGFIFGMIDGIYHISKIQSAANGGNKTSRYSVFCEDSLVNIDVRNAPIVDILTTLTDECGLSIIIYGNIEGSITANYNNKPISEVLGYILRGTLYSYKQDEDIYFIGNKSSEDLFDSRLIKLNHISNTSIQELIPATISKLVTIKIVNEQNGLVVTGPSTAILEVEKFIDKIDIPPAQVLFEAIVVDYKVTDGLTFDLNVDNSGLEQETPDRNFYPNIDYSATGDQLNFHLDNIANKLNISNIGHLPSEFFVQLKILIEKGIANIRSRPQIAALNGHSASIEIGTSQYYIMESQTIYPSQQTNVSTATSQRFEVIEADMSLEVTPHVTESGEIIVDIQPQFNSPATALDPNVPPTINRRVLKSTVRLRDGETIVLGGMIQNQENASIKKFPILGDLPIIGSLFRTVDKTNTKNELMVYITPHVYYGAEGSVDIKKILDED
ncbi:MAG: secretin and TonB N-terminal domain-containing protein [Candidatus Zixiibacteriota bacterium]